MNKYLFVYRSAVSNAPPPSPEQMQQMMAAWGGWKAKFQQEILDLGDALKPQGRVMTAAGVTDGPFIEAKEVVGGYSIVQAKTFEDAVVVARECPMMHIPGARIEIRELAGH
jgi:hypothetical protein